VAVHDVQAVELQVIPERGVKAGDRVRLQLQVRNAGSAAVDAVPVRFYVDGVLHDERRVRIAEGETATVEFTWKAVDGGHVVSAAIGDPRQSVARAAAVYVEPKEPATIPSVPLWLGLVVVAAAAMIVSQRRSRRDA
jgi:hypothetical protein